MDPVTLFRTADPAQRVLAARRGVASLVLPWPGALHGGTCEALADAPALRRWGRETASLPMVWDVWRRRVASFVAVWQPSCADGEASDPHDRYFGIGRCNAEPVRALLHGVLTALDRFCHECTGAREFREHAVIPAALIEIWQLVLQEPEPVRPPVENRLAEVHGRAPDPVRRWLQGHHVFAALTQGLTWSLLSFERLQPEPTEAQTQRFLQGMARLYRASAAAFRFTADFSPAAYEHLIRPSMSEPHVPAGFSGSMSVDHGHLVSVLTRLRPALAQAAVQCPEEHAAMVQALTLVYDDHRHVCARFAGAQGASLRSARQAEATAAVEMIDRFKVRRLELLTCPVPR
jgi:hypothetical protein